MDSAGVFAHHTLEGSRVDDPARASWSLTWTAPDTGERGAVAVHAAANSGNGDDSPFGDLVYTWSGRVEGPYEGPAHPGVAGGAR